MATVCGGGAAPECLRGKQCTTADALSQVLASVYDSICTYDFEIQQVSDQRDLFT